jgi:hypothetical protein
VPGREVALFLLFAASGSVVPSRYATKKPRFHARRSNTVANRRSWCACRRAARSRRVVRTTRGPRRRLRHAIRVPSALDFPEVDSTVEVFALAELAPEGGKARSYWVRAGRPSRFGSTLAAGSACASRPATTKLSSSWCAGTTRAGWCRSAWPVAMGCRGLASEPVFSPNELSQRARASLAPELAWRSFVPGMGWSGPRLPRSGHESGRFQWNFH